MIYLDEVMEIVLRKIHKLHRENHKFEPCQESQRSCGKYAAAEREVATVIEQAVKSL